jgi:diguanylate cyclase (GGDEF)-like protein
VFQSLRIRYKVFALVLITSATLSVGLVALARVYLEREFGKIERDVMQVAVMQSRDWLQEKSKPLSDATEDWGNENIYLSGKTGLQELLVRRSIQLFLRFDEAGVLREQLCLNSAGVARPCEEGFLAQVGESIDKWSPQKEASINGFAFSGFDYFAVGITRISLSMPTSPSQGFLVLGTRIDARSVPPPGGQGISELLPTGRLSRDSNIVLTYVKKDSVDALLPLSRIEGLDPVALWARVPRTVYLKGMQGVSYWSQGMAILCVVVALVLFLFLDRSVMRRLERLRGDLEAVGSEKGPERVRESGRDDIGVLARQFNVTLEKLENSRADQLRYRLFDQATKLPNRANFVARLEEDMRRNDPKDISVVLVNLDRFQRINDSLGWMVGDHILFEVGNRILRVCGKAFLARIGGNEFGLLMTGKVDIEVLARLSSDIEREFLRPFLLGTDREDLYLSASIGISTGIDFDGQSLDEAIRHAQVALHKAQLEGGRRIAMFDSVMDQKARERMELERDLSQALQKHQLVVAFQPIVELGSPLSEGQKLAGFESLVRWMHPERGMISPVDFIPLAVDSGLIVEIGGWILRESLRQMVVWDKQFPELQNLFISVNLSVRQFRDANLIANICETIKVTGFPIQRLKLEITESAMMDDPEDFKERLERMRALHLRFSLDDFGTGYSSLRYLDEFPVQTLKVDKSFVDRLGSHENPAIVSAVVRLAHSMNLDVVAEGIESPDQAEALRVMGCEYGQGFLFSRPRFALDLESYLREQAEAMTPVY